MFGIDQNISSSQLYLLYDMANNQISELNQELMEIKDSGNTVRESEIKEQILRLSVEISEFEKKISDQLESEFNFSVEEIYSMYGQYEQNFISVEFHRNTESFKKYGAQIGGTILYGKSEREKLEKELKNGESQRTNGYVRLDTTPEYPLKVEQREELRTTGFKSGDVYEILHVNLPRKKEFGVSGKKEIPNRVNIEIDLEDVDSHALSRGFYLRLLNDGNVLIPYEHLRFMALVEDVEPEALERNNVYEQIKSSGKETQWLFRYHQLKVKIEKKEETAPERSEFALMRRQIIRSRMDVISKEIRSSANVPLKKYIERNSQSLENFAKLSMSFEDEALVFTKQSGRPIYWNFKSAAHIYLKHTNDLGLKGRYEEIGTNFQYDIREVKTVLKKCIEDNIDEISQRIDLGKGFRLYGERAYYFNGNYYSLNIDANGRVTSFYPHEHKI